MAAKNVSGALGRAYATLHAAPKTAKSPTAIVMLNMGGPGDLDEVHPFLRNLFLDRDLMRLPAQRLLARYIAWRRSPSIVEQYAKIGGGSPILRHTQRQGELMSALLDELRPQSAPHRAYPAFRYARPLTRSVMQRLKEDGVTRAVAFTQYPQYSCSTTGSSLNEVFRSCGIDREAGDVEWSVVDRWGTHPGLVENVYYDSRSTGMVLCRASCTMRATRIVTARAGTSLLSRSRAAHEARSSWEAEAEAEERDTAGSGQVRMEAIFRRSYVIASSSHRRVARARGRQPHLPGALHD